MHLRYSLYHKKIILMETLRKEYWHFHRAYSTHSLKGDTALDVDHFLPKDCVS